MCAYKTEKVLIIIILRVSEKSGLESVTSGSRKAFFTLSILSGLPLNYRQLKPRTIPGPKLLENKLPVKHQQFAFSTLQCLCLQPVLILSENL